MIPRFFYFAFLSALVATTTANAQTAYKSTLVATTTANAQTAYKSTLVATTTANAQTAYKVIYPSGGDDYPAISQALANSRVQPVQLALDSLNPTRVFSVSHELDVPGTLICENTGDANGSFGTIVIYPTRGFVGSAVVATTNTDAHVKGCAVYGGGAPANVDCFANHNAQAPVFDSIGANYCTGEGLNLTPSGVNVVLSRLIGHSYFYNSTKHAIAVNWDPSGGSASDLYIEGADVGTNCLGGCDGDPDVYFYASNGQMHDMRIEWSWNSGFGASTAP